MGCELDGQGGMGGLVEEVVGGEGMGEVTGVVEGLEEVTGVSEE